MQHVVDVLIDLFDIKILIIVCLFMLRLANQCPADTFQFVRIADQRAQRIKDQRSALPVQMCTMRHVGDVSLYITVANGP